MFFAIHYKVLIGNKTIYHLNLAKSKWKRITGNCSLVKNEFSYWYGIFASLKVFKSAIVKSLPNCAKLYI